MSAALDRASVANLYSNFLNALGPESEAALLNPVRTPGRAVSSSSLSERMCSCAFFEEIVGRPFQGPLAAFPHDQSDGLSQSRSEIGSIHSIHFAHVPILVHRIAVIGVVHLLSAAGSAFRQTIFFAVNLHWDNAPII